ncbi:MAG TPA: peptidyl-prolyl cis-trans isomerase [Solirubrobacteraceae bacterium]|jgi:parvulin-like peptidyl-prolyl isomerase|nr:peptidyl-prolyl cis-trans isomerase [Solirubrobacteraceae bacterium]
MSRKLAAVAAFFVIGAAVAGCGSSVSGNSVATVAGNPISLSAFNHWAYVAAKEQAAQYAQQGVNEPPIISSNPTNFSSCEKAIRAAIPSLRSATDAALKTDCKQVFTSTSTTVMNYLIQSYWLQLAAHKAGIKSSDINASFQKLFKKQFPTTKKQQAYLASTLKSSGETLADIKYTYRSQQLLSKLMKRVEKPVNAKAIAAYYAAHKSSFGTAETRDLHLIRTKTQGRAQAAYNALKGGQSWDKVAKQYAADPSAKNNGGTLTNISSGEEEAAASKAIFAASLNQLTGPVKGIFGYYVLEVTKITAATQESLAKATPAIKSQLNSTQGQSAENTVLKNAEKAWKGQTKCRAPHYQTSYCSNYKAPKTTTTATSTPSTTTSSTSTSASTTSTTK